MQITTNHLTQQLASPVGLPLIDYDHLLLITHYLHRFGIDAIITNQPERTLEVLREPEFRERYRMANLLDDPFEHLKMPYFTNQKKSLPSVKDAISVVDNTKNSFGRYISQTPEALLDLGHLLIGKLINQRKKQYQER